MVNFITDSCLKTKKIGEILAKEILSEKNQKVRKRNKALVFGLEGDLGGGKTTFLQGFAKGLGIREKTTSPTFVLIKKYRILNSKFKNFYHIDCYRIRKSEEISMLGFKEIIFNPENIVAIEWISIIKDIVPKNTLIFKFKFIDENKREIIF